MRVLVDELLCCGHAICEEVAPEIFRVNEAGLAIVLVDGLDERHLEAARLAMLRCPAEAITLVS